jgi:hypothetical protein
MFMNMLQAAVSSVLALVVWLLPVMVLAKLTSLPGAVILVLPGFGCGLLLFTRWAFRKARQRVAVRQRKILS